MLHSLRPNCSGRFAIAATAPHVSRTRSSTSVGVICLLAGALFGLMSVYSNSRETCAVWVLVALVFAFAAGFLFRPARSMSYGEDAPQRQ